MLRRDIPNNGRGYVRTTRTRRASVNKLTAPETRQKGRSGIMTTRFEVRQVQTCSACNGNGEWDNELWGHFWAEHGERPSIADLTCWMEKHGGIGVNKTLPPPTIRCVACAGAGEVVQMIDLQVALHHLSEKQMNDPLMEAERHR